MAQRTADLASDDLSPINQSWDIITSPHHIPAAPLYPEGNWKGDSTTYAWENPYHQARRQGISRWMIATVPGVWEIGRKGKMEG